MERYLALIRGVNVGGVVLKMEVLRELLQDGGYSNVRTYIQSGNALFESDRTDTGEIERGIEDLLRQGTGLDLKVIVRSRPALRKIAELHPFSSEGEPKCLFVTLLRSIPDPRDVEILLAEATGAESFEVDGATVYSIYREGFGTSRFSNNFLEKKLRLPATTRNWNSLQKLRNLMDE